MRENYYREVVKKTNKCLGLVKASFSEMKEKPKTITSNVPDGLLVETENY